MKTHEKRALVSKALLRATTCLLLTSSIGISPAFASHKSNEPITERVQQASTISGKVTDANGEGIIGASVTVKGVTSNGTITDPDGKYGYPCKSHIGCILYNQDLSSW